MRYILALLASIFCGPALAQMPDPGPGPIPFVASTADALGLRNEAPRRTRMSFSIGVLDPVWAANFQTSETFLIATPIEAPAYAIKIGVANPFSTPTNIVSAAGYFSDSYGGLIQPNWRPVGSGLQTSGFPTANSVYQTCTLVSGNANATCSNTALLPSAATMYVLDATRTGVTLQNVTVTVTNGTVVHMSANAAASGSFLLQFANVSTACNLYFDNRGADSDTVALSGTNRSITFVGDAANTNTSTQYPFVLQWSDFAPCASVARADGGTKPLLFVYITEGSSAYGYGRTVSGIDPYDISIAASLGGHYIFTGQAWTNNVDYANNPVGSGFKATGVAPALAISYLTDARGWNVAVTGDSLSSAPPDDNFSSPVFRACKRLSTPQAPCEWTSFAWGATAWAVYGEAFRNNLAAIGPSAIVLQPVSRNEAGQLLPAMQTLLAKAESYTQRYNARLGFLGAFPLTTSLDGNAANQAMVATIQARLLAISKTCQPSTGGQTCPLVPVLDPVPIVSRAALGGNAWDYLGLLATANGNTAATATSIPVTAGGQPPCYAGDVLTDITTAGVITPGATVTSSTSTAIVVPGTAVISGGILSGDQLVCSYPGWAGGFLTQDNTHHWYPATLLMQPAADVFMRQLLGLQ